MDLELQWELNYIFGLLYKHKVKYKYTMLCNAFDFSKDETIWSKDREIPTMLNPSFTYCCQRSRYIFSY